MDINKYGIFYTPKKLADFISQLLLLVAKKEGIDIKNVLDPSCGEGALLKSMEAINGASSKYYGIDINKNVLNSIEKKQNFKLIHADFIIPTKKENVISSEYTNEELPPIDTIIANPPWSTEKLYTTEELVDAGLPINIKYNDIYPLFIEKSLNILKEEGIAAFIVPDSIFESYNENLRKYLVTNFKIKIIARLGEKFFKGVNRATTIIIVQKVTPDNESKTICFRLNTESRERVLREDKELYDYFISSSHEILQNRFITNKNYIFDIDTKIHEEKLLRKLEEDTIDFDKVFTFGRGIEISKKGEVIKCDYCGKRQGYTKKQKSEKLKKCKYCNKDLHFSSKNLEKLVIDHSVDGYEEVFVGENIKRYQTIGKRFIKKEVSGINYKNKELFLAPKILIRKTGLGIYAFLDTTNYLTTQTVYILKLRENTAPLIYYLALINSRVIYYYYLKIYGENEWKSHPYLTKKIIYNFPLKTYTKNGLTDKIIETANNLNSNYNYEEDLKLESLIMKLYNLSECEKDLIIKEMRTLPKIDSVKEMKIIDYV
ncbi:N-6 DNA methylase [Staphylococcus hominis]